MDPERQQIVGRRSGNSGMATQRSGALVNIGDCSSSASDSSAVA
jgi:hypothetical protein